MKTSRIICSIMLLLLGVALVGCSHKNAPDQELIEGKGKDFTTLSRSKAVDVVAEPYVGVKAVPIRADEASQAELNTRVMLRKRGTLSDIAATDPAPISKGGKPAKAGTPPALELPDLLDPGASGGSRLLNVSYEGPLRGLLDHVAVASGYGWDFDSKTKTVVFSRLVVRTFTILGAPGKREYKDQITNKSRETSRSSIGGNNINQTVATSDTSSQTAQSNTTNYKFDI